MMRLELKCFAKKDFQLSQIHVEVIEDAITTRMKWHLSAWKSYYVQLIYI